MKLTIEQKSLPIGETIVAREIELRVAYIREELSNNPLLFSHGWNALHAIVGDEQYKPSSIEFERVSLDTLLKYINESELREQMSSLQKELEQFPGSCTIDHNQVPETVRQTLSELISTMESLRY